MICNFNAIFQSGDIEEKRELVKDQLIFELSRLCNCDISSQNIQADAFGCGQLDHLIIYRGRILGSNGYSALGLVGLMQSWINTEQAFLTVDSFRMRVDPTCTTRLDTINAPDCPLGDTTDTVTIPTTSAPATPTTSAPTPAEPKTLDPEPKTKVESSSSMRSGEIGGIAIGAMIVILLLALLLVIAAIVLYKNRKLTKILRSALKLSCHL